MEPGALIVVAAAMLSEGRVLLQQRPAGKHLAGLWEFPGGKVERGESPEAALARELREELGIEVAPGDLVPLAFATGEAWARSLVLLLYRVDRWEGEPRAIEAPAMVWTDRAALRALPLPPLDIALIEPLLAQGLVI